jgi:Cu-Zn family superoxide dismutase
MFEDTRKGLRIQAALGGLPPGEHGFHIHEKPDCGPGEKDGKKQAGIAAGSHLDPATTGKHMGPEGAGHRGDLPVLKVDANGNAAEVMFVLRLGIDDLRGHALMIHEGGDNYSDQPKPLGGGAHRVRRRQPNVDDALIAGQPFRDECFGVLSTLARQRHPFRKHAKISKCPEADRS